MTAVKERPASSTSPNGAGSLKALCPCKAISEAVQTVGHAVTGRTSLPILNHILIRSEGRTGTDGVELTGLRLIATDMELGISCWVPATIQEEGGLTAPAKTLAEVLANLPERGEAAVSVDRSHTVRLHCDRSDYKILGLPTEGYPHLPEVTDATMFRVPQAVLREMIKQTLFAVSPDDARAILTGVLMVFDGETLKFVATDTHRLAVRTASVTEGRGSQNAIVPSRAMNELNRLLTDADGDVEVTMSDVQVRFSLPGVAGVEIVSRLIEGQFPNYQRVIPAEFQKRLTIPVDLLLRAVRRASIVARENAHRVILKTDEEKLILTAESQTVGNAYEEMEIIKEGDDVQIAFNAKYLLDVLNVLDCEGVYLDLTESLKPGVMRPVPRVEQEGETATASDYLCVLMPMQIV